jgi:hypothetical protein
VEIILKIEASVIKDRQKGKEAVRIMKMKASIGILKNLSLCLLMAGVGLFTLSLDIPIDDLERGEGVSFVSEAYAQHTGSGHSGGGHSGGQHLGHRKGAGSHGEEESHATGGGHSIEDQIFRGGHKQPGVAGQHPGGESHSVEDQVFHQPGHDSGEDHTDMEHDHTDTEHDHTDSEHEDGGGKGPKFMGGR